MLFENKRLPNMTLLINDTNYEKRRYNYGYGYYEKESKNSWLKKSK